MLVLGGENERGALAEVLALDLETLMWSEVVTDNPPLARSDFAAVLDAPRDRVIVFGARQAFAGSVGEVWASISPACVGRCSRRDRARGTTSRPRRTASACGSSAAQAPSSSR